MTWHRVAHIRDLRPGEVYTASVAGERVALCLLGGDRVVAFADRCTHDGAPFGDALVVDSCIECPRHGARFDLETGRVVRMPATAPLEMMAVRLNPDGSVEVDPDREAEP